MFKWVSRCLDLRVGSMANRTALHEDDRMMAVLARDGSRQPGDEFRLRLAGDLLKTLGRKVVTFVDDEVAVVRHAVIDHALPHKTLNERDIERAGGSASAASDSTDGLRRQAKKRRQSFYPLIQQLPTMHENQRVDATPGNQPRGDHRLSEGGRCRQNAVSWASIASAAVCCSVRSSP